MENTAVEEMGTFEKIKDVINDVPENGKYFIPNKKAPYVDCRPDQQESEALKNLKVCTNFLNVSPSLEMEEACDIDDTCDEWFEKNRSKFALIQQADGGDEFAKYIRKLDHKNFKENFRLINKKMIELIQNGVSPMNKKGLLHLDIKPENMVIKLNKLNPEDTLLRLIDWGFAINTNRKSFPQIQYELKVTHTSMYNVPLSNILLDNGLIVSIDAALLKIPSMSNSDIARRIFKRVNDKWDTELAKGDKSNHLPFILENIMLIYNKLGDINFAKEKWIEYIKAILNKYINNKIFNVQQYFEQIYEPNVDIYSVLTSYISIIKEKNYIAPDSSSLNYKWNNQVIENMKKFVQENMFSSESAITKYHIPELINKMKNIDPDYAAATRLQAARRGQSVRESQKKQTMAATQLQSRIRGQSVRKSRKKQTTAATQLQALTPDHFIRESLPIVAIKSNSSKKKSPHSPPLREVSTPPNYPATLGSYFDT